jgi:endo-1,4-beta-xylanase
MNGIRRCVSGLLTAVLTSGSAFARELPAEIPLWPGDAPGSEGKAGKEIVETGANGERKVSNIRRPSITPWLPAPEAARGAAVLVIPGGAHRFLAIDHEGYNVAAWLRERGIAAFVLKNRLARETNSAYTIEGHALADTRRAVRMIRAHAKAWNVNPARVGVMGFSAGGELAALACMKAESGNPEAADPSSAKAAGPISRR